MKKIIIVDTGNANFLSIKRAVEKYEKNVLISNDKDEIKTASKNKQKALLSIQEKWVASTHS